MRRSVLCILVVLLMCFAFLPRPAQAQLTGLKIADVKLTRTNYPSVSPLEGSVSVYAGQWNLCVDVHNYDINDGSYLWQYATGTVRLFLDDVLVSESTIASYTLYLGSTITITSPFSILVVGYHGIRIEVWHGTETTPQDTYSFNVLVVKSEVSNLQASSKVIRAKGDNSLMVSFANGGNEDMRQAVLSVADSKGLTITPSEVELGDVETGENTVANFTISSPASVTLGTVQVTFSLSFIDYAGVSHTENVTGEVEVYRIASTLSVATPSSIENGATVEILATLVDSQGNPITNENIVFTAGGTTIGSSKTDSGGVARVSYTATETGTFDVGASFAGSASYETSSVSSVIAVTPQTSILPWIIALIAGLVALVVLTVVLAVWRGKRKLIVKPVRKAQRNA